MQDQATLSRRRFVGTGTLSAASAGFAIVGAQTARGTQASSKLSVGLIGVGGRGTYDASIIQNDPRAQVTALSDLFDDRVEAGREKLKLEKPAVFKDFEKLLSAPGVDAVIIATPPFEHPRMLEAAVQSGKHVFCEKPMGVDLAGCKRVIRAARRASPKQCVSVGYQQRYGPVYLEAYKRMQAGEIGTLANARGFWIAGDPFRRLPYDDPKIEKLRNWFCYREYSGDIIVEQDCHILDDLHWFLGALPIRAVGMGGVKVRTTMDILDHLSLSYEFPGGMNVNFEANQISPAGFSKIGEEFTGTAGLLLTSRQQMVHIRGRQDRETIPSKRDITIDALENFITRILNGELENVAERAALSTMIAILGRTAIYEKREANWKEFGSLS
jgi:myo-inositol 2-dehydrogenase / D-chiro-inositol 1-dehydrogenase